MRFESIASGSSGNCIYVGSDTTHLLMDVGISRKRTVDALKDLDLELRDISGIFITHEHSDHINGLPMIAKKSDMPIYATRGTIEAIRRMPKFQEIDPERFIAVRSDEKITIGDMQIDPMRISHDAAEPVGYRLKGRKNVTLATDLGFVTSSVQAAIEGADVLILESNHDPEVLKQGSYPWPLKRRILSNRGHLANSDAAWALIRMQKRPEKVFLAHLSEENNRPELAENTVQGILERQGVNIDLTVASQTEMVSWYLN